jgi:hypothetical protein
LKVLTNLASFSDCNFRQCSQVSSAGAGPGADAPRRP